MSVADAEICRRAADIVQKQGLCKGALWDEDGRVCMWGALHQATTEHHGNLGTLYGLGSTPIRYGPIHVEIISRFDNQVRDRAYPGAAELNDLPETDEKDVAKFLMSVADAVELA